MKVLVTGGAGYIGSHVALHLSEAGHQTIVYDNLSTGHRSAVLTGELVVGDLADESKLAALFETERFDAVMHFAGSIIAPESVAEPLKYYANNTANSLHLLQCCARFGVGRLVFSSSAAVYGIPPSLPIDEDADLAPINPYGASKLMTERMIQDHGAASDMRYAILRYFNVAGADPQGRLGQATPNATHLIKVACQAAIGLRPGVVIYGTNYPTPDGTGVRDYIHVSDLAAAHVMALEHLATSDGPLVLNCGYGRGVSVREVVDCVERVSGRPLNVTEGPRRPGDPPALVAANRRICETLGWRPRFDDLACIVRSALEWEDKVRLRKSA